MQKSCLLLDLPSQEIVEQRSHDERYVEIDHDQKWYLRIPLKEFNQIKAVYTTSSIISPFSFLYQLSKEQPKEHCLWGAILEEHIFLVVFHESRPLFFRIYKRDERDLKDCVEDFMREFYESKESFFIEEIVLCYEPQHFEADPTIAQELLLPVEFKEIDYEKICNDPQILAFTIEQKESVPSEVEVGINKKFILSVAVVVMLFLVGYDLFLRFQIQNYTKKIEKVVQSQVTLANENNNYSSDMLKIDIIRPYVSEIVVQTQNLEQNIRSIFDLIPQDTYLRAFVLDKHRLKIAGVSKDRKSFLNQIDKKLSNVYEKRRYKITKRKSGFLFEAFYEEGER